MDPNTTQNQTPVQIPVPPVNTQPMQQTLEATQPIAQAQFTAPQPPQKNMKKLVLVFIVIIILIVGGIVIFLLASAKPAAPQVQTQTQVTPTPVASAVSPTPLPIPSPEVTQSPEQALQQVTIDDPNADIQSVTTDAQQL